MELDAESGEGESQLLRVVEASLRARQWTHRRIADPLAIEVTHDAARIPWKSYAQAKGADRILVYYSLCPETAPPPRHHAVAAYITQASFDILVGGFEMNWEDGEVRCKTSVDLHGAELSEEILQGIFQRNHQAMIQFLPNLLKVIRGEQEAPEAYAEATEE